MDVIQFSFYSGMVSHVNFNPRFCWSLYFLFFLAINWQVLKFILVHVCNRNWLRLSENGEALMRPKTKPQRFHTNHCKHSIGNLCVGLKYLSGYYKKTAIMSSTSYYAVFNATSLRHFSIQFFVWNSIFHFNAPTRSWKRLKMLYSVDHIFSKKKIPDISATLLTQSRIFQGSTRKQTEKFCLFQHWYVTNLKLVCPPKAVKRVERDIGCSIFELPLL